MVFCCKLISSDGSRQAIGPTYCRHLDGSGYDRCRPHATKRRGVLGSMDGRDVNGGKFEVGGELRLVGLAALIEMEAADKL